MTTQQLPEPGVYPGVPFAEYLAWPAMSSSTLRAGLTSMAHLKARIDGQIFEESPALNMGSAIHCRLLEPSEFPDRYKVATPCCAELKSGKRKGDPCGCAASAYDGSHWYCGKHSPPDAEDPGNFISAQEAVAIEAIAKSVFAKEVVHLLRQKGGCETSIVWESRGVRCKSRMDKLITDERWPTIIDLKSARTGYGKPDKFGWEIESRGYHVQAAMYSDAVKQQTDLDCHYVWVVVEKDPPYAVSVIQADPSLLKIGRTIYRKLMANYKVCVDTGEYPGYPDEIVTVYPSKRLMEQYKDTFA